MAKKISFTVRIQGAEWEEINPTLKYDADRECYRLNGSWSAYVNAAIRHCKDLQKKKLPCAFSLKQKFYSREGYPYFILYGHCKDKTCRRNIEGNCWVQEMDGADIKFNYVDTSGLKHKATIPSRGALRAKAKKELGNKKLFIFEHYKLMNS